MKKLFLSIIYLLIGLSIPFLATAQEIIREGDSYVSTLVKEFKVNPAGNLIIKDVRGDINVISWSKESVEIVYEIEMDVYTREEAEKIIKNLGAEITQSGDNIIIDSRSGKSWVERNFKIKVPKKFNLSLQTEGGDIEVASLEGKVDLNTAGGDIRLTGISGAVDIHTSGGSLTLVDVHGNIIGKTSGGEIQLENITGPCEVNTSGGEIQLRQARNNIVLKTSGGDIVAEQVDGDLSAQTSGGSLEVNEVTGRVDLKTSGGDIEIVDIKGPVSAQTSAGDIEGYNFDDVLSLQTSAGDISLNKVRAGVTASTSVGSIEIEVTLQDFKKPHRIDLSTNMGDIHLILPANMPATIHAEIQEQKLWKSNEIYSDFPLTQASNDQSILRSTGDINGGGDVITLKTNKGDIYIKKGENK